MKRLLITLLLLTVIVAGSVLWWLYRSRVRARCDDSYVPAGVFTQRSDSPDRLREYYSAMQEAPFACLDSRTEAYRFLIVPSFDPPASIRIWREGNHSFVAIKQLTQPGIPKYGGKDLKVNETRPLSDDEWNEFKSLVAKASFWNLPPETDRPGLDAVLFLLEGHDGKNYHVIARWNNTDTSLMDVTDYFFDTARLQWKK